MGGDKPPIIWFSRIMWATLIALALASAIYILRLFSGKI